MKKLLPYFIFYIAVTACSFKGNIQVDGFLGKLVKKEWVYRYPDYEAVQYWRQLDDRGETYEEFLRGKDTGFKVGTIAYVLIRK